MVAGPVTSRTVEEGSRPYSRPPAPAQPSYAHRCERRRRTKSRHARSVDQGRDQCMLRDRPDNVVLAKRYRAGRSQCGRSGPIIDLDIPNARAGEVQWLALRVVDRDRASQGKRDTVSGPASASSCRASITDSPAPHGLTALAPPRTAPTPVREAVVRSPSSSGSAPCLCQGFACSQLSATAVVERALPAACRHAPE